MFAQRSLRVLEKMSSRISVAADGLQNKLHYINIEHIVFQTWSVFHRLMLANRAAETRNGWDKVKNRHNNVWEWNMTLSNAFYCDWTLDLKGNSLKCVYRSCGVALGE